MHRPYYPALDGLRGVAVLLVVAYHAFPDIATVGAWGVTIFFVLSGFLITGILVRQSDRAGGIRLRRFWARRAVRLIPALLPVTGFCWLVGATAGIWPTLTYTADFFEATGADLGLLYHTWSLAVEEHFYIVWPLIIAALPARWRVRCVAVLLGGAGAWRLWLLMGPHTIERIYFSTDTNAFSLLAGCLLAIAPRSAPRLLYFVGAVALALSTFGAEPFLWSLFGIVALAAAGVGQATAGSTILELPLLRWFGRISYGLYLWHVVLLNVPWVGASTLHRLGASLVAASLSWYAIEQPVLRWHSARREEGVKPIRDRTDSRQPAFASHRHPDPPHRLDHNRELLSPGRYAQRIGRPDGH